MANQTFNYSKPRRNQSKFTDAMKIELKAMYHLNTLEELAEHFGLTVKEVKNQVDRQYLTKRDKGK